MSADCIGTASFETIVGQVCTKDSIVKNDASFEVVQVNVLVQTNMNFIYFDIQQEILTACSVFELHHKLTSELEEILFASLLCCSLILDPAKQLHTFHMFAKRLLSPAYLFTNRRRAGLFAALLLLRSNRTAVEIKMDRRTDTQFVCRECILKLQHLSEPPLLCPSFSHVNSFVQISTVLLVR